MLSSRFFWKLYLTFASLVLVTVVTTGFLVHQQLRISLVDDVENRLFDMAASLEPFAAGLLAGGIGNGDANVDPSVQAQIQRIGQRTRTRITLVAPNGMVVADSDGDPRSMDNHADRPEIIDARDRSYGVSRRFSDSLEIPALYVAIVVREAGRDVGTVRTSIPLLSVDARLASLRNTVALGAALGILVALGVGLVVARRITAPVREMTEVAEALRAGSYDQRIAIQSGDEFGQLGATLNGLADELTNRIATLDAQGAQLRRLEQLRSEFVANVSHELKTPLTAIRGYVETLAGGAIHDDDHNLRFLRKIDQQVDRLNAMVGDVLSLARIEAEGATREAHAIDWRNVVRTVVDDYEEVGKLQGHVCHVDLPDTPVLIAADEESMTQVLSNLLDNAIKYTPADGAITVRAVAAEGVATLEIEDTGIGISAADRTRIFERFFRTDRARSRGTGGTGLGLSIVKHLVQGMGGEVEVDSEQGRGSRFIVRVPTT